MCPDRTESLRSLYRPPLNASGVRPLGRNRVSRLIALVLLLLAAAPAHAAELSSSAKEEIDALLKRLETSDCQFYRNGSWHDGSAARDHLQMKLEYLVEKGLITDSEEFIKEAGTKSSMSGQPYKVRCPNQTEQSSAVWLGSELRKIRQKDTK
jgi:hypothetical protein